MEPQSTTRRCWKCGETKSLEDFYNHKANPLGKSYRCKACTLENAAENRQRRREYGRARYWADPEKEKARNSKHPERQAAYVAAYRRREGNTAKQQAQWAVKEQIRQGKLQRGPCEVCGKPNAEAHHASYAVEDRLKIQWLCRLHHAEIHRLGNAG